MLYKYTKTMRMAGIMSKVVKIKMSDVILGYISWRFTGEPVFPLHLHSTGCCWSLMSSDRRRMIGKFRVRMKCTYLAGQLDIWVIYPAF